MRHLLLFTDNDLAKYEAVATTAHKYEHYAYTNEPTPVVGLPKKTSGGVQPVYNRLSRLIWNPFIIFTKNKSTLKVEQFFKDKSIKLKDRTEQLCRLVAEHGITPDTLMQYAEKAKDTDKATCIESLEYATKTNPGIMTHTALSMVIDSLTATAPRVKWESARVVGNCIHLFPNRVEAAVKNLLDNSEHEGTVVRWSTAFALAQILAMNTSLNSRLVPAIEAIIMLEEKNSIAKIYATALEKITPKKKATL